MTFQAIQTIFIKKMIKMKHYVKCYSLSLLAFSKIINFVVRILKIEEILKIENKLWQHW